MGNDYFLNPIIFLIDTLFSLYIAAFMLRFLLQWVRADFYNPLSQFLVKITNPLLRPLRRIIPGWGGLDFAAIVIMIALTCSKILALYALKGFYSLPFTAVLVLAVADLLSLLINVFLFSIFIQIILSWVAPYQHNPASALIHQLNEPLLRPARRLLPPVSGFDFSPMAVILMLYTTRMLLLPLILKLA